MQNDLIQLQDMRRRVLELEHEHATACVETQLQQTRLERIGKYRATFETQQRVCFRWASAGLRSVGCRDTLRVTRDNGACVHRRLSP